MNADRLRQMSLAELEATFCSEAITDRLEVPRGRFGGEVLLRLDTPGARHPLWRAAQLLMFEHRL